MPEETFQSESAAASSDPPPKESQKTDPSEIHVLDEILSRAQRIRESQPEVAKPNFHFVLSIVGQCTCTNYVI